MCANIRHTCKHATLKKKNFCNDKTPMFIVLKLFFVTTGLQCLCLLQSTLANCTAGPLVCRIIPCLRIWRDVECRIGKDQTRLELAQTHWIEDPDKIHKHTCMNSPYPCLFCSDFSSSWSYCLVFSSNKLILKPLWWYYLSKDAVQCSPVCGGAPVEYKKDRFYATLVKNCHEGVNTGYSLWATFSWPIDNNPHTHTPSTMSGDSVHSANDMWCTVQGHLLQTILGVAFWADDICKRAVHESTLQTWVVLAAAATELRKALRSVRPLFSSS